MASRGSCCWSEVELLDNLYGLVSATDKARPRDDAAEPPTHITDLLDIVPYAPLASPQDRERVNAVLHAVLSRLGTIGCTDDLHGLFVARDRAVDVLAPEHPDARAVLASLFRIPDVSRAVLRAAAEERELYPRSGDEGDDDEDDEEERDDDGDYEPSSRQLRRIEDAASSTRCVLIGSLAFHAIYLVAALGIFMAYTGYCYRP